MQTTSPPETDHGKIRGNGNGNGNSPDPNSKSESETHWKNLWRRQRHTIFLYTSLVLTVGIILNLLYLGGAHPGFYVVENSLHLAVTVVVLVLYLARRLPVAAALYIVCIATQLAISAEAWQAARDGTQFDIHLTIGNMVLAALNILAAVVAYLRILPTALAALAMLSYGYCTAATGNAALENLFVIFLLSFGVLSLLAHRLMLGVHRMARENEELKDDEEKVLNLFDMDRTQLMAYIKLAKAKGLTAEQTGQLLDGVGKHAMESIRDNVSRWLRHSQTDFDNLAARLPELTAVQVEICGLILRDKKLKEIMSILHKTEGNITAQRTNIRARLGLRPGDDLLEALRERTAVSPAPRK